MLQVFKNDWKSTKDHGNYVPLSFWGPGFLCCIWNLTAEKLLISFAVGPENDVSYSPLAFWPNTFDFRSLLLLPKECEGPVQNGYGCQWQGASNWPTQRPGIFLNGRNYSADFPSAVWKKSTLLHKILLKLWKLNITMF